MAKAPTTAVAKAAAKGGEVADLSALGFEAFEGAGMETVTVNDMLVPRLGILQDLSPQLKKTKVEYIEGAEVGQIADLGTGDLYPEGVLFLPVHYRKDYLEWAPRSTGKGLVDVHSDPAILDRCKRDEKNRPILDNGNLIAETAQFFGLNLSAGRRRCFLPMASTQLKKARKWITLASGEKLRRENGTEFTAPLFYRTYALTTALETNNDGEWYGWVVTRNAALPELDIGVDWMTVKDEAVEFRQAVAAGEVKGDTSGMDGASGETIDPKGAIDHEGEM